MKSGQAFTHEVEPEVVIPVKVTTLQQK